MAGRQANKPLHHAPGAYARGRGRREQQVYRAIDDVTVSGLLDPCDILSGAMRLEHDHEPQ
jgi:hypothetical protein